MQSAFNRRNIFEEILTKDSKNNNLIYKKGLSFYKKIMA